MAMTNFRIFFIYSNSHNFRNNNRVELKLVPNDAESDQKLSCLGDIYKRFSSFFNRKCLLRGWGWGGVGGGGGVGKCLTDIFC